MKVRIRPSNKGTKGLDWTRIYFVDVKSFLFWRNLKTFSTLDEADDFVKGLADFNELIFIKYF